MRANHNTFNSLLSILLVFQTYQRYNFESKSQLLIVRLIGNCGCFRPIKDTILRANHNTSDSGITSYGGVSDLSKIQFWEQITTAQAIFKIYQRVFQTYQRYNFESKSQHCYLWIVAVERCFRPIKDTILRANHNGNWPCKIAIKVFQTYQRYNFESKSQPCGEYFVIIVRCFRPIKDTILRANHNCWILCLSTLKGVSDLSKIQFWEQITTIFV